MTKNHKKDIGASVRTRLLNVSRERGQVFDLVLTRYALERFLYRLSISGYRSHFVLKGALLVTTWFDAPHRPTRDLDLLGYGDSSPKAMLAAFREICAIVADDGIQFQTDALRIGAIREELKYGGLRVKTAATLAGARINLTIDIGFGDAVEPGIEEIDLPTLLDLPSPRLRAYARETVIAEKFEAMVARGQANSRMKDFYDVWMLSKTCDFDIERLARAIAATFSRRETVIPETLESADAFKAGFFRDAGKLQQWAAFIRELSMKAPPFEAVISELSTFIDPPATRARALIRETKASGAR